MNEALHPGKTAMFLKTRVAARLSLLAAFAFAASLVLVESANAETAAKTPKRTSINFEDQLVEGQSQKPELFYLLQQRNNNFKRLIRLRENFLPEMRKTSEDIGRAGGRGSGN